MEIETLGKTALFRSMTEEEIHLCLKELRSQEKKYKKGTVIMHAGSLTDRMGLVLSGSVTIESNDVWGNCTILSHVGSGQFFAETYALLPDEVMLVDVRANEDCNILFVTVGGLFKSGISSTWKDKLTRNLLMISASRMTSTILRRNALTCPSIFWQRMSRSAYATFMAMFVVAAVSFSPAMLRPMPKR